MVMTFFIVIGILLGALLCALVLWIVEAVRLGYTPTKREKHPEQVPNGANDDNSYHVDGVAQSDDPADTMQAKQPQGP